MFADRPGSILYVTSPVTDSVVAAYAYDGFGAITQTQGTMRQPYGYTGREFDRESGLYYYRARSYGPATGMFLQSDPIGFIGGLANIYSYTMANTFNADDPSGLNQTFEGAGVSAVGASNMGGATAPIIVGVTAVVGKILGELNPGTNLPMVIHGDPGGPRDCTEAFHKKVQDRIDKLDRLPHSCNGQTGPFTRLFHANTAGQLWAMRSIMNNLCYRGGDPGHQAAAQAARRAQLRCLGF